MKKFDIYETITNRIIEQLDQGIIPWHRPWKAITNNEKTFDITKLAFNRITKTPYSFINQMILKNPGEYASFMQWKKLGGKIKKGAEAEIVVFWKWLLVEDEKNLDENGKPELKKIPILKYYQVFHISDIEGVEPLKFEAVKDEIVKEFDSIQEAENLINEYLTREKISLSYGGNEAYYSPTFDNIKLPARNSFQGNKAEFYSTAFHEIGHSTGHHSRLNRLKDENHFGNEPYSKEELVAEITASGILNYLNIETEKSFKNSVAYIQGWSKYLKDNKKAIVFASAQAEKAINYIYNIKEEEIEVA